LLDLKLILAVVNEFPFVCHILVSNWSYLASVNEVPFGNWLKGTNHRKVRKKWHYRNERRIDRV